MDKRLLSHVTFIPVDIVITIKSQFYIFMGTTYKWNKIWQSVKSGKCCSYGNLAGAILRVHKSSENTKCGNIKARLCFIHFVYECILV
jgi:hypothetical protein